MHSIGQENSSLLPLNKQEYIMVSRRNMLKTGLTAVFGACAVQTASASEVQQKSQNNFDVVILGAGTGGLVTAIEAADLGLKPVVLEKMECR